MRRFRVCLAALLFILLALPACSPSAPRNDFAYADTPFSLSVEGTYLPASDPDGTPRPFAATVTAGAPVNGDPTLRDLTVTFTAPPSLCGATVTAALSPASEGAVVRSVTFSYPSDYGEVKVAAKGRELDGLLRFAEAFLPIGDVAEVSPAAQDRSRTVTRRADSGAREAVFVFSEGQTFPNGVTLTDRRGRVEMVLCGEGEKQD